MSIMQHNHVNPKHLLEDWDHRVYSVSCRIFRFIKYSIAVVTIIVVAALLVMESYRMITVDGYLVDINNYLHSLLTIAVGLKFVKLLIDTSPTSILEMLSMLIIRYAIIPHKNPWINLASIIFIAGPFAIHRFLVSQRNKKEE